MATIVGQFVDANTNKPLSEVVMDVYPTGDMSGSPQTSFQSNDDGTYNISSSYFDTPGATIAVQYPGYGEVVGAPGFFNGIVQVYPADVTMIVKSVPWWAWLALAIAAFFIFKYRKQILK